MSLQAELAATFVDEWWRAGLREAVLCPGSRSAPLALALLADDRLTVHVRLDERSAGFFALGAAAGSGRAVAVVVTSGTAAGELLPAVLEADLSGVPLVVVTADRPPELQGVAAAQTVDQVGLFGRAVRHSLAPGVLDEGSRPWWRSYASRLVAEALGAAGRPGPVHADLAFREPLAGRAAGLPPGRAGGRPWHEVQRSPSAPPAVVDRLLELAGVGGTPVRGVLVAGGGAAGEQPGGGAAVRALAGRLGWPVVAEARAWPRCPEGSAVVVAAGDLVVRSPSLGMPELVVHLGAPPTSKAVAAWSAGLAAAGVPRVHVDPSGRFVDPERAADLLLVADPGALAAAATERLEGPGRAGLSRPEGWAGRWAAAEAAAQAALDEVVGAGLDGGGCSEAWVARALHDALPDGAVLVASSSMPIRHVERYGRPRPGAPRVVANRGANGIDGVVSTVLGVASSVAAPTVGLVGDLAFLHDVSALVWGRHEAPPAATLVVVDNGGGEIFATLPYAGDVDPVRFARGFTTPQRHDPAAVAAGFGWPVAVVGRRDELVPALDAAIAAGLAGPSFVVVRVRPSASRAVEAAAEAAAVAAVVAALGPPAGPPPAGPPPAGPTVGPGRGGVGAVAG